MKTLRFLILNFIAWSASGNDKTENTDLIKHPVKEKIPIPSSGNIIISSIVFRSDGKQHPHRYRFET